MTADNEKLTPDYRQVYSDEVENQPNDDHDDKDREKHTNNVVRHLKHLRSSPWTNTDSRRNAHSLPSVAGLLLSRGYLNQVRAKRCLPARLLSVRRVP